MADVLILGGTGEARALAKALVDAGQVPMAIAEIRRAKALASVLEQAKVVDTAGEVVDLSALDEAINQD